MDPHVDADGQLEEMSDIDCDLLLQQMAVGRIAFTFAGQPLIMPVNYRYVDGDILFRSFQGQKFHAAMARQRVCFEIDNWDDELRLGWSIIVKGHAEPVENWAELQAARELRLDTWLDGAAAGPWVRIVPDEITGRRIV